MAGQLTGKTALITGAGRGIGRAIAVELARAGADVLLTARSAGELADAVGAVGAVGGPDAGQARTVAADITDDRQRQRVAGAGLGLTCLRRRGASRLLGPVAARSLTARDPVRPPRRGRHGRQMAAIAHAGAGRSAAAAALVAGIAVVVSVIAAVTSVRADIS